MGRGQRKHGAHLTVEWYRGISDEKLEYYGQEGENSRKGVDLSSIGRTNQPGDSGVTEGVKEVHIITDPYRPEVGATSPNNAPLIFESSEEFPARRRD